VRGDDTFEVPLTLQRRPSNEEALPVTPCG